MAEVIKLQTTELTPEQKQVLEQVYRLILSWVKEAPVTPPMEIPSKCVVLPDKVHEASVLTPKNTIFQTLPDQQA